MNKAIAKTRGAVLYTRVSTGEQDKHGTSPETQLDACRKKALALSLPIVAEHYDGGVSGAFLLARPGMQAALADVKAGRADTLICSSISRYSRDVEHQQAIKKAVRAAGGRLVFCDADFEDTPSGDLNFTIQGGFAEYEKAVIRERLMGGKRKKAEQGFQVNRGNPPFGYHVPTKEDVMRGAYPLEQLGKYVLIPEEAEIVRWMFAGYAAGELTLPEIARRMNARGVPTKRGGAMWRSVNFSYLFRNPVYKGQPISGRWQSRKDESRLSGTNRLTGGPIVSDHAYWLAPEENWIPLSAPAVVSEEVWERVQDRLRGNKARRGGNPLRVRMLAGRVFCPECGGSMITNCHGERYQYYQCGRHRWAAQDLGQTACRGTRYHIRVTEEAVTAALIGACQSPESAAAAVSAFARAQAGAPAADPRRELAEVDRALRRLEAEEAAAVQGQCAGILAGASPSAYAPIFAGIAARRKGLEDRRRPLARAQGPAPAGEDGDGQGTGAKRTSGVSGRGFKGKGAAGKASQCEDNGREAPPDFAAILEKARRVLSSPDVAGSEKRKVLGTVIEKVICRERGATVYFLPGVLGGPGGLAGGPGGSANGGGPWDAPGNAFADTFADTYQKVSTS